MKLKLSALILLLAMSAFSARPEYLQAVLGSETLQKFDILSVTQTDVYRCLGCYGFRIEYKADSDTRVIHAKTEENIGAPNISVELMYDPEES